jgi:DNA-binding transcriptional LysR family regulator
MGRRLRGGGEVSLRIGALETVLRAYVPQLLRAMRQRAPGLHFKLLPATLEMIENGLLSQEMDIGIAPLLGKRPAGIKQQIMVRVPMALVVPDSSRLKSTNELWRQDRIAEPLISGPAENAVSLLFLAELQKRKIDWFPSFQLNSQELVTRYAAEGFGVGLILFEPGQKTPDGVRILPLMGFPAVPYGLLWMGVLTPLQREFVRAAEAIASSLPQPPETSSRKR